MQAAKARDVREQVLMEEWQARTGLAALYRFTALYHWDDLVFKHISMHVPGSEHQFLINPYGFLFEEIMASSLVKVDFAGSIVMETPHFINPAGFMIHSAVHEAREDALGVYHTHTLHGGVVSAQKHGLLPISQSSRFPLASIGYHGYEGLALSAEEKPRLVADLGGNQALILRNYGLLTVEHSTAEALLAMYVLEATCRIQIMAQSGGSELIPIAKPILQSIRAQVEQVRKGLGGNLVWPALLRKLDRIDPSYKQ